MKDLSITREFFLSRVFAAEKEQLFSAWTDPEHLRHWWGPGDFQWIGGQLNLYPGGSFHYCMRSPEGAALWGRFLYLDVSRPDRLIFLNSFSDEEGNPVKHPLMPDWPLEILNVLSFREIGPGKTRLLMRGIPHSATAAECRAFNAGRHLVRQGFASTWMRLGQYLSPDLSPDPDPA